MEERVDGMSQGHSGTGVSHDLADFFAPLGIETMDRTLGTGGLLIAERTPVDPLRDILPEFFTLCTKLPRCVVVGLAVHADHDPHSIEFASDPSRFILFGIFHHASKSFVCIKMIMRRVPVNAYSGRIIFFLSP